MNNVLQIPSHWSIRKEEQLLARTSKVEIDKIKL
jgi:hypothetical protein